MAGGKTAPIKKVEKNNGGWLRFLAPKKEAIEVEDVENATDFTSDTDVNTALNNYGISASAVTVHTWTPQS